MPSKRMQPPVTVPKRPRGRPPGSKAKSKPVLTWQDRLMLNPGEVLCKSNGGTTGNFGQFDTENYDVVDAQGQSVGTVVYSASTSLRPPCRTSYWLVQKDLAGTVIVDTRW